LEALGSAAWFAAAGFAAAGFVEGALEDMAGWVELTGVMGISLSGIKDRPKPYLDVDKIWVRSNLDVVKSA
jgi:hypothetical protein